MLIQKWAPRLAASCAAVASIGWHPALGQQTGPTAPRPAAAPEVSTADLIKAHPDIVLSRPSTDRAPYDPTIVGQTVALWEEMVKKDPRSLINYRELAGAYLARQRECGDIADAVRAEAAARQSLVVSNKPTSGAMIRLAQALLAQHRFPEALATAQVAAKLDSKAERIVIDVLLELGDYDAATRAVQAISTEADDMNLLALQARFAAINGKPDQALQFLREAARVVDSRPDMPAEVAGWCHTMVGHTLIDSGQLEAGERACETALSIFPNDYRAMTGMAEAATWRGDHAGALKWSLAAIKLAPQNPEALRLAGEAYAGMGKTEEASQQYQALRDLAHSFPRIYDQHWAIFCLDMGQDLDEAMTLARNDLALRHDIHVHDTLAYACLKKGLLDEADREMTLAMARGTQEAGLFHHAALIAQARGDNDRAKTLMATAARLNPYLVKNAEASAPPTQP